MSLNKYLNSYEFDVTLPISGQKLKLKPLNTNGMKKLLIYEDTIDPIETEDVLDTLLDYYIIDDIDVKDLYLQDRYYLFVELRKISKGSVYKFTITCPHCNSQSLQVINLDELKNKKYDESKVEKNIKILNNQLNIEMGFVTRKEQIESYKLIDRKLSDTNKKVEMSIYDLALSMKKITNEKGDDETPKNEDGSINLVELSKFVGDLPESEHDVIQNWLNDNYYGYDMDININCEMCKKEIENYKIPLNNFLE